ncbi:hypothetical protein [Salinimonas lutimaris]|uniref:hypothetical protein n=1 Tax=Salinimonas lutimaris TaxID=914153 RepID=UPI0010C115DF|nr:hypothetical protein [Salinimonas lutimaris]
MFEENYKCLVCGHIGLLDFDYDTTPDKTFATFSGSISCTSCETTIECTGQLDIYEDQPVSDPMDWLMDIQYDCDFDVIFVNINEIPQIEPGPLDHLCR